MTITPSGLLTRASVKLAHVLIQKMFFCLKRMTQEAHLCWRQTAGKTPVSPCPTTLHRFGGEASGQSPSQSCALVSRAQESPKRALSGIMALGFLFTKSPFSSSATSEWDVQKQDPPHSTACVPRWDLHHLLTRMSATLKKPEGNLHTPPFPQGKQFSNGFSQAGAGTDPCTQISSRPHQGEKKGWLFFPL